MKIMYCDDIKGEHYVLIVAVPDTKTGIKRTFTVTNPEFVRLYRKYAALVPCTHPELKTEKWQSKLFTFFTHLSFK
jgi:hypothetical protein